MVENFANVAKTYAVRTVSVYAARPGDGGYSVGNALFPVEAEGRVTLPDALGQQLGLRRIGRHERIEGFDVDEATGVLTTRYYPGREPQPDPPAPCGEPGGEGTRTAGLRCGKPAGHADGHGEWQHQEAPQDPPPAAQDSAGEAIAAEDEGLVAPPDEPKAAAPPTSSPAKPSGRRGR